MAVDLADTPQLVNEFHKLCVSVVDSVSPFQTNSGEEQMSSSWVSEEILVLRRKYRRTERAWKVIKLTVHLEHLEDLLISYSAAAETASTAYFSQLINANSDNPRCLFKTIV